jgi:hypothetical protein
MLEAGRDRAAWNVGRSRRSSRSTRRPFDLVEVLDLGLSALGGHQLREVAMHVANARGDLVQQLRFLEFW